MLGTRGVPAQYGGFETAVEEIGARLVKMGHEVVVYCRNPGQTQHEYLGMQLVNLPALRRRSLETLSHTGLSVGHAIVRTRPDVALLFNAANAPFLPLLRAARVPVAVHLDGLEWQRAKWAGLGRRYYHSAERLSVRWADEVIADARGIAEHVRASYGRESVFIPYGAPIIDPGTARLGEYGLIPDGYHLVVARFEPENHIDVIIEGYARSDSRLPLVVVGTSPYSDDYTRRVSALAADDPRVSLLGPEWDQHMLDQLYAGCRSYLHGHSVGGTNPSLLRAMGAGAPVSAWDVVFNREVTGGHAQFFSSADDVVAVLARDEQHADAARERGNAARARAARCYTWDEVADQYAALCSGLTGSAA